MRTIAIGDVHGCAKALRTLIEIIAPQRDDTLVFLGDYVDRGPDSRDVIEQVIALEQRCRVVALRGNHEIMLLGVMNSGLCPELWLASGGQATVSSYGGALEKMPPAHRRFLAGLEAYYETDEAIFVHANYFPDVAMEDLPERRMYWEHLSMIPEPHQSGKRIYVGHTPQISGEILDRGHLVCVDTCCFGGLWLTALDIHSGRVWQTDIHGHERRRHWAASLVAEVAQRWKARRTK
ncbi:metallophosphoesterase family protein [Roseimaritima sediminicola]|uniref:metallophosphoesterase family protein n=1 Tax=Roseimaritima sediminicola TaxID=2662066 RepID=UPI0012982C8D|nr:metallophosphoesterase family protein [Roseimaritima sediminicola]